MSDDKVAQVKLKFAQGVAAKGRRGFALTSSSLQLKTGQQRIVMWLGGGVGELCEAIVQNLRQ